MQTEAVLQKVQAVNEVLQPKPEFGTSPKLRPRVGSSGAPFRKGDPDSPEPCNPSTSVHGVTRDEGEGAINVPLYSPSVLSCCEWLCSSQLSVTTRVLCSSPRASHQQQQAPSQTAGTEEAWELSPSPEIFECSASYHNLMNWLL